MSPTNRTSTPSTPGRRFAGAISSAAAVALLGVTALSPQTAQAAGVVAGHPRPMHRLASADPTALPAAARGTASDAVAVAYRGSPTGWVRV
jgi:hypothetical protein